MNRRAETRNGANGRLIAGVVVVLVLVLVAVYFLFLRDDDKKDKGSKKPSSSATQTFTAPGSSFTFTYPGSFVETSGPQGFVWIAGVGKYDILSVKRIANVPTSPGRLKATVPDTLKLVPGTTINSRGTEQHGGVDMVTYTIATTIDGNNVTVRLYYFSANGVTWQLGCESQSQAAVINSACDAALQSFQATA